MNKKSEQLWYYRDQDGKTQGPIPSEQVKELAAQGGLVWNSEVSADGQNWKQAFELVNFAFDSIVLSLSDGSLNVMEPFARGFLATEAGKQSIPQSGILFSREASIDELAKTPSLGNTGKQLVALTLSAEKARIQAEKKCELLEAQLKADASEKSKLEALYSKNLADTAKLIECERSLEQQKALLAAKSAEYEKSAATLKAKEDALAKQTALLEQLQKELASLKSNLKQKDSELDEKDKLLDARDDELAEKTTLLTAHGIELAEKSALLAARDDELAEKDALLMQNAGIADKLSFAEEACAAAESKAAALEAALTKAEAEKQHSLKAYKQLKASLATLLSPVDDELEPAAETDATPSVTTAIAADGTELAVEIVEEPAPAAVPMKADAPKKEAKAAPTAADLEKALQRELGQLAKQQDSSGAKKRGGLRESFVRNFKHS